MAVSQKLRIELSYDPAVPLLGIYLKNLEHLFAKMFAPLCSLQHDSWWPRHGDNQCPCTGGWRTRVWCLYAVEHCPAIAQDEILPVATTWTGPESVRLSGIIQTGKFKNLMLSLMAQISLKRQHGGCQRGWGEECK